MGEEGNSVGIVLLAMSWARADVCVSQGEVGEKGDEGSSVSSFPL